MRTRSLPREGDDGLYSQAWFPIAQSPEVTLDRPTRKAFLGSEVVAFRDRTGAARVVSPFCPHMGANLGLGDVVDGELRCAFHFWRFDGAGGCVRTGSGDPVPQGARVFAFPTVEKYGLIWAFNGETPLFDVPQFSVPEDELIIWSITEWEITGEPWEYMCNSFDFNHTKVVHGFDLESIVPLAEIHYGDYDVWYNVRSRHESDGTELDARIRIVGSNTYVEETQNKGRRGFSMYPGRVTEPGHHVGYQLVGTTRGDGSPEQEVEIETYCRWAETFANRIVSEDAPILNTMRFRPVKLTRSDAALGPFLQHLRRLPRAHPAAEYL